jgi:hypothetical protein
MKRIVLALALIIALLASIVAGILLVDLSGNDKTSGKLYTYPLSVGEKTYIVTVRTNYSSAPEVSYSASPPSDYHVSVDFRGNQENSFCNITIPTELIGGELSVIDKYYVMSADQYTVSNNGTHNSVYFTFNHTALVKHFEVRGTEGMPESP